MLPSKVNKKQTHFNKSFGNSLYLLSFYRKKQFRYLLETKGKKPGLVNEENSDSKRLVGENTNRATLNYTTRDFYNERLEVKPPSVFGIWCLDISHQMYSLGGCTFPPFNQWQRQHVCVLESQPALHCVQLETVGTMVLGRSRAHSSSIFISVGKKSIPKKSLPKIQTKVDQGF